MKKLILSCITGLMFLFYTVGYNADEAKIDDSGAWVCYNEYCGIVLKRIDDKEEFIRYEIPEEIKKRIIKQHIESLVKV